MAYPSTLDTTSTIPVESANTPLSTNHITSHSAIQTAIIAIETLLGVTASAVTGTFNYILGEITGSDKAVGKTATQTLENKTLGAGTAIDLGSDAEGDIYYRNSSGDLARLARGTDNYILKMNGNVPNWETETTVVAATESTEGISRLATAAQVTSGAATESGYPLVVTPDQLALSTPVFNGSGLTDIPRWLASSGTDVVNDNSSAEVTMLTYALPGNTLGSNKGVRIRGAFTFANNSSTTSCTFKIKYGGTTVATFTENNSSTSNFVGTYVFDFLLIGAGTTGTQEATTLVTAFNASSTCVIAQGDLQTSSIDSTTSQNILITAQNSSAAVGRTSTLKNYFIEKIV